MKNQKRIFIHAVETAILTIALLCFASCKKNNIEGKQDKIDANIPQRIVSLSPSGTEILYAIGAKNQLVARTNFCNWPPEVKEKPSVGGFSAESINIETLLSYKPDFVYGTLGIHDSLVPVLKDNGIEIHLSDAKNILDITGEIRYMGRLTGHEDECRQVVDNINYTFEQVRDLISSDTKKVKVYYEVWQEPFMSVGSQSYINSIIQCAGGENIFEDIDSEYPLISEEAVIARSPQVIIIPSMNSQTIENIQKRNGWQNIEAVKNGKIYFVDADIMTRPSPRITYALVNIASIIHPEIDFSHLVDLNNENQN